MFFNSLQLITHLPLLNSGMPGIIHYFLQPYLDLARLKIDGLYQKLYEIYDIGRQVKTGEDYRIFG